MSKIYLGEFKNQSGHLTVGDPCYDRNLSLVVDKISVHQGTWKAYLITNEKEPQSIFLHHKKYGVRSNIIMEDLLTRIPVDSGQLCVHDSKYWGKKTAVPKDFMSDVVLGFADDDPWYEMHCKITLHTENCAGVTPFGAVSSTAYGDGTYFVEAIEKDGKFAAFRVYLI